MLIFLVTPTLGLIKNFSELENNNFSEKGHADHDSFRSVHATNVHDDVHSTDKKTGDY